MTQPGRYEFATPKPVSASMRIGAGAIIVNAEETSTTTVVVSPYDDGEASRLAAQNTRVTLNGDRLHIEVPDSTGGWLFRRSGRIQIDLRMPLDSQLRIQVGSADLHAEGRLNLVEVKSGSGNVNTVDCENLWVQTGSGDVRAELVRGRLHAATGSGDVSAGRVQGPVQVNSASGDVSLDHVFGDLRVTSASGDVNVQAAHRGQVRINSASGDVFIGVPIGTKVFFDLGTMSGTTSSDLPVSPQPPAGGATALNLQVHTMSGDINVFRVGADPDAFGWNEADWGGRNGAGPKDAAPENAGLGEAEPAADRD